MEVVVQLSPDTARALQGHTAATEESDEVIAVARRLGGELHQTHPGVDDAALMTFYHYDVPDRAAGERVADAFRACAGVDGAYWKPPAEPA